MRDQPCSINMNLLDGGYEVGSELAGRSVSLAYADGLFLISWIEESTTAEASAEQVAGPWLTDVILDFNTMRAMASWTGPTADGGSEHVLDQATMAFIELDAT